MSKKYPKLIKVAGMAQMGKTSIAIYFIQQELQKDRYCPDGKSLHFVFTQNTFMNQSQFKDRLIEPVLAQNIISYSSQIKMNKTDDTFIKSIKTFMELENFLLKKELPQVVVTLSNKKRFTDILNIIKSCQKIHGCPYKRIYVYFDEIHVYLNQIMFFLEETDNIDIVNNIYGLSATLNSLDDLGNFVILPNQIQPDLNKYFFLSHMCKYNIEDQTESDFHIFEASHIHINTGDLPDSSEKSNCLEHATSVLENFPNYFFSYNNRTFIPTEVNTESHFQIKDIIFRMASQTHRLFDPVVIILNGSCKKIFFRKDFEIIEQEIYISDETDATEFSRILPSTLEKHDLLGKPYFITGHICVSIGITLCSPELGPFTGSILYHSENESSEKIYQMAGRTAGNMKHWEKSKDTKTLLFCSEKCYETIQEEEENVFRNYIQTAGGTCNFPQIEIDPTWDQNYIKKMQSGQLCLLPSVNENFMSNESSNNGDETNMEEEEPVIQTIKVKRTWLEYAITEEEESLNTIIRNLFYRQNSLTRGTIRRSCLRTSLQSSDSGTPSRSSLQRSRRVVTIFKPPVLKVKTYKSKKFRNLGSMEILEMKLGLNAKNKYVKVRVESENKFIGYWKKK
jgi:hypothetical protein